MFYSWLIQEQCNDNTRYGVGLFKINNQQIIKYCYELSEDSRHHVTHVSCY